MYYVCHTEYDTCSRCDYTTFKELPATGHKSSDWIIDKASSCNDQGHQHKECTICGEVLVDEPIVKSGNCNSNVGFIQVLHLIAVSGFMILIRRKKNS